MPLGDLLRHEILADGIEIYLADCREILPNLAGQAAAIITDPPYRLTAGGTTSSPFRGCLARDRYANDGCPVIVNCEWHEWIPLVAAACRRDADLYIMANDKNLREALNAIEGAGLGLHTVLVWDKLTNMPTRWYMKQVEFVAYAWKGDARTIRRPSSKQLVSLRQVDESLHPTEKPVGLMQLYVENSTDVGELVLDPFMGSGTTGVAAVRAGRRFVGIELDPVHFETACARISAALVAPASSMFRRSGPRLAPVEQPGLAFDLSPMVG